MIFLPRLRQNVSPTAFITGKYSVRSTLNDNSPEIARIARERCCQVLFLHEVTAERLSTEKATSALGYDRRRRFALADIGATSNAEQCKNGRHGHDDLFHKSPQS